jgi:hypothetical protein
MEIIQFVAAAPKAKTLYDFHAASRTGGVNPIGAYKIMEINVP